MFHLSDYPEAQMLLLEGMRSGLLRRLGRYDTGWEACISSLLLQTLDDGSRSRIHMMRRRVAGVWVYRRMSDDELADYYGRDAI